MVRYIRLNMVIFFYIDSGLFDGLCDFLGKCVLDSCKIIIFLKI